MENVKIIKSLLKALKTAYFYHTVFIRLTVSDQIQTLPEAPSGDVKSLIVPPRKRESSVGFHMHGHRAPHAAQSSSVKASNQRSNYTL